MPWRLALGPYDPRRVNDRDRTGRVVQQRGGEKDRRSARDETALAGPEWLGHPVAQNAQLTERMTKVLTTGTFGANAPWRPEERLTCRLVDGSYPS